MSFEKGLDSLKFIFLWGKSCVTSTSSIWKDGHGWGICSLTLLFRFKVDLCTGRTRKNIIKALRFFVCYFWTAFYVYRFSLSHSKNKDFKENSLFFMKDKKLLSRPIVVYENNHQVGKITRQKDQRVWKCANMQTLKCMCQRIRDIFARLVNVVWIRRGNGWRPSFVTDRDLMTLAVWWNLLQKHKYIQGVDNCFFSIKNDLARSCFQFWPKIGDEGDKRGSPLYKLFGAGGGQKGVGGIFLKIRPHSCM